MIGETNQERKPVTVGTRFPSETDLLVPATTLYSNLTAEDLTLGDVDALVGYLTPRLEKAKKGAPFGSDVSRALSTVQRLLEAQAGDTRAVFAAAPVTEDLLDARKRQWNNLTSLAITWHRDADFSDRWNHIEYRDAAAVAKAAAQRLSRLRGRVFWARLNPVVDGGRQALAYSGRSRWQAWFLCRQRTCPASLWTPRQ